MNVSQIMAKPKEVLSPEAYENYRSVRAAAVLFVVFGTIFVVGGIALATEKKILLPGKRRPTPEYAIHVADSAGRAAWVHSLQTGATLESIEIAFLTSPEYLHHIDTDFVQSLYINILGRTGSAIELAAWYSVIRTVGLPSIANGFVGSQEYRTDSINADFQTFLHRPVFPGEISTFASLRTDLLGLEAAILGTPAYVSVA